MNATRILKAALLVVGSALLAACGGGGGSGNDSGFNPPGITVRASAASSSVQAGRTVNVTVEVRQANGAAISDGTGVNAVVSPANVGSIVALGPNGPTGGTTAQTVGGIANFRFTGTTPGNATVTFSVPDPNAPARNVTANVQISVSQGIERLTIEATTDTLPINAFNVDPFFGSPYMAEVTITLRTASGELVNAPDGVQVSVNPVGNTGGFSTLDDPETEDINEFVVRLGQGPVDVVAGKATVFLHSLNFSGQTTMTVTGQDPETNETVTASKVFNIISTATRMPATLSVSPPAAPQYVQGSGGNTSGQFEVGVADGIGQPVPNPVAGNSAFNNVRLELIGDAHGARLSGVGANGQPVSGTSILVRTTNGVTGGVLISGDSPGNVLIRATADRADNNVDNGIADPVFSQRTVAISDGVLFDIDITQPIANALTINPVSTDVEDVDPDAIPPSPDGTYSLTIAAIATDRLGNPVLPGTTISFGLIDEPQETGFGDFYLSGANGDPQESGKLFTAANGGFTTRGGGAGPGDALVIFGEEVIGNRDHESARRIESINSPTSLSVSRRFNPNNTTGSSVNSGPVLPYVIGRAADGNIAASGITNADGVVRVKMNYPVSKLGKRAIIWAQGDGAIVNGEPKTVADVEVTAFAGVAPATLVVTPATIFGNSTQTVVACVYDRLGSPIGGVDIGFNFQSMGSGTGSIDGRAGRGVFASATGFDGCTVGTVVTSGMTAAGGEIHISGAGDTAVVEIEISELALIAQPAAFFGSGGVTTLTLVDAAGRRISGVQLIGNCTSAGDATVQTRPVNGETGVTNANGQARFDVVAGNLNQVGGAGSGNCTYSVVGGSPSATVRVQGVDVCDSAFSPLPEGCPSTPTPQFTVTLNLNGAGIGAVASSTPAGIACTKPDGANRVCTGSFTQGVNVAILINSQVAGAPQNATFVVDGDCTRDGGINDTAIVVIPAISQNRTCTVTLSP